MGFGIVFFQFQIFEAGPLSSCDHISIVLVGQSLELMFLRIWYRVSGLCFVIVPYWMFWFLRLCFGSLYFEIISHFIILIKEIVSV